MRGDGNFGSTNRLGHSLVLFFISFGHDGAPSLPQELKKITQQLTALPLIFMVVPALIQTDCDALRGLSWWDRRVPDRRWCRRGG